MRKARSMRVLGVAVALLASVFLVSCWGGGLPPADAIPSPREFSPGETKKELKLRIRPRGEWKIEEIKIVGSGAAHFIAEMACMNKTVTATKGVAGICPEFVKTFNHVAKETATFIFKAKGIGGGANGFVTGTGELKML